MISKHKICFESAETHSLAATYYRVNDTRVTASDLLITMRKNGISFWLSTVSSMLVNCTRERTTDGPSFLDKAILLTKKNYF